MINEEQKKEIKQLIFQEGFDYCFMRYSDFKEIDDEYFHKLRIEYRNAQRKFLNYIETGLIFENLE